MKWSARLLILACVVVSVFGFVYVCQDSHMTGHCVMGIVDDCVNTPVSMVLHHIGAYQQFFSVIITLTFFFVCILGFLLWYVIGVDINIVPFRRIVRKYADSSIVQYVRLRRYVSLFEHSPPVYYA